MKKQIEIINKKASFNFDFVETYIAGVVLQGYEIVGIREGKIDISEAYCYFIGDELFLKNSSVGDNDKTKQSSFRKPANRDRKLLLNKGELKKIRDLVKIKGYTVVPYKVIINDKNLCKVVIAVAKGKKNYDKRAAIKERDIERQLKYEI